MGYRKRRNIFRGGITMASGDRIPIGGTNWQRMTPQVAKAATSLTTNQTVVNVVGSGILTGIFQSGATDQDTYFNRGLVTIIIDGVTLVTDLELSYVTLYPEGGNGRTFGSLPIIAKFNQRLEVRHRSMSGGADVTTTATYNLE